jgi:CPA2 family monovalent cation:H+ antiporter-2
MSRCSGLTAKRMEMASPGGISTVLPPVVLLLGLSVVAVVGSRAVKLSPIVGFIVTGAVAAAVSPGFLDQNAALTFLADLGVVFLLFDIGLHFSPSHLREQARDIFVFGPVQVLFGTAGLAAIGILSGLSLSAAFLAGCTLALSSTAVVVDIITRRHQADCPVGQTATAILVFQDVAAILILIVATALGTGGALAVPILLAMVTAGCAFVAALLTARLVVRPLFSVLARLGGEEVFTAAALAVALATGWAAASIGLSMALGAFLGGMAVAETPFRVKIVAEINPFRGLALGFFFFSVGFSLDIRALTVHCGAIFGIALLIMAIKVVTNGLASLVFRWSVPGSLQLGFLLSQSSEFAFVLLGLPGVRGLIGAQNSSILIASVALTLAATGPASAVGRTLAGALRGRRTGAPDAESLPRKPAETVLIVGMGTAGRSIADAMTAFGIGYHALERDPDRLRKAIADGYHVSFGDAANPGLWPTVYQEGRHYSVLTAPALDLSRALTPIVKAFHPAVERIVAVPDERSAAHFRDAGVRAIVDRGSKPGLGIARQILAEHGVDSGDVEDWIRGRQTGSAPARYPALI